MSRLFSNRDRHFDMGMLPTELLQRDDAAQLLPARMPADQNFAAASAVTEAFGEYEMLCAQNLDGACATDRARPATGC